MIENRPTEILGESINHWDRFYAEHYEWLYQSSLLLEGTDSKAKQLTQRLLTKLLLRHPEVVINSSKESLSMEVAIVYPDLKDLLQREDHETTSRELLHLFYSPN